VRRITAEILLGIGLFLATLAASGFWLKVSMLEPDRTQKVASTVLESSEVRTAVAGAIADAVAQATNQKSEQIQPLVLQGIAGATDKSFLTELVARAHEAVIGIGSPKIALSADTLTPLVGAKLAAQAAGVSFVVPQVKALATVRDRIDSWITALAAMAGLLVAAAFLIHNNRAKVFRQLGWWLLGMSAWELVVTWVVPAFILPAVTTNPWALLASRVAAASAADLRPALVGLAVAGVASLLASVMWGAVRDEARRPKVIGASPQSGVMGQPVVGTAAWNAWAMQNAASAQRNRDGARQSPPPPPPPASFGSGHSRDGDGWGL
jgi:hypothetical protein